MAEPESQARSPPPRTLALQAHSRKRLGKTIATRNQFCGFFGYDLYAHQLPEDLRELGEESLVQEKASKDKALADETRRNSFRHLSEADIHTWAFNLVPSFSGS